jgi:chromosome transmission fidelity protein 4
LFSSSELTVKLVDVNDPSRVRYLRDQVKPVKHLSFHPSGLYIALSASDGALYVYSLSKEEPELLKKVDGLIRALETDSEASSKAVWHPDGRAFAAPTAARGLFFLLLPIPLSTFILEAYRSRIPRALQMYR